MSNKRQRTYSMDTVQYPEAGTEAVQVMTGNARPSKHEDPMMISMNHGGKLVDTWRDPRQKLDRFLSPATQIVTRSCGTTVLCDSGVQSITQYNLWEKAELKNYLTAATAHILVSGGTSNNTHPTIRGTSSAVNLNDTVAETALKLPLLQSNMTWHNSGNTNVSFTLYEWECRRNTNLSPEELWEDYLEDTSNAAPGAADITSYQTNAALWQQTSQQATLTAAYLVKRTMVGQAPHGKALRRHWSIKNKLVGIIPTGKKFSYTITKKDTSIYNSMFDPTTTDAYVEGYTTSVMLVIHGEWIASNDVAQQDIISTSDGHLRYRQQGNTVWHGTQRCQTNKIILTNAAEDAADGSDPLIANNMQLIFNNETEQPDAGGFVADT